MKWEYTDTRVVKEGIKGFSEIVKSLIKMKR